MKKLLFALVCLILMALGSVFIWLQFPFVEDPVFVDSVIAQTEARYEELKIMTQDRERNGYFQPELLPFWSEEVGSPAGEALLACREYLDGPGETRRQLWESKDPAYLAALEGFKPFLKPLEAALSKELLAPEASPLDQPYHWRSENWPDKLSSVLFALSIQLEALCFEDRKSEAIELANLCWRLGNRLALEGVDRLDASKVFLMAANSIFLDQFSPESKVPAESWLSASHTLTRETLRTADLTSAISYDLGAQVRAWRKRLAGQLSPAPGWSPHPGWREQILLKRELRAGENRLTRILKANQGGPIWLSFAGTPRCLSPPYLSYVSRLTCQVHAVRTQMAGLATCTGLFAYRERHGHLPDSLEQLSELGLKSDPDFPWSSMTYRPPDTLLLPWANPILRGELESQTWMKVTPEGLEFQLTPQPQP